MINIMDEQTEEKEVEDIKTGDTASEEQTEEEAAKEPEETDEAVEKQKDSGKTGEKPKASEAQTKKKEKKKKKDPRDEKIEELNDKHIRLMAEFENFRKRTDKEKEMMFETGAKSVIEKILPVVDNFERALGMADSKAEEVKKDPFMEGMEMIYKQLMTELDNIDVKPIEAVGKPFDPEIHNAVMQEESEEYESGTVAKELQKGYTYRGTVVRHSMVSVVQ